jgi:hypothetical protein
MWLDSIRNLVFGPRFPRRRLAQKQRRTRLVLEWLDERLLPSAYTAGNVSDLIAEINAANQAGGSNTITLVARTTFQLSTVNNTTDGATGLPVIAANDNLTIVGNGDSVQRTTAKGTPAFRLLDVAAGASLTLQNLTLQGGWAFGSGVSAEGGAIYNQGTLLLTGATVQNNIAQGSPGQGTQGQSAAGGAIYSGGSLTLQGSAINSNQAIGGQGGTLLNGCRGGDGLGGGLYVAGGTVSVSRVAFFSNTAQGGAGGDSINGSFRFPDEKHNEDSFGGPGGNGLGGGLYVASGTASLSNTTADQNSASGGGGGKGSNTSLNGSAGLGEGGGLFIDSVALVRLDAFTQANVTTNNASTSGRNIFGTFTPTS